MEPLWSPVVATGGKRSQLGKHEKPQEHAKTGALGCDQLQRPPHGKERVDGSSPSEGFKDPCTAAAYPGRHLQVLLDAR